MPEAGTRSALDLPPLSAVSTFSAKPSRVGMARQFLAGLLDASPLATDAVLCLSELVTNAVLHSASRHPGGTFTVQATASDTSVRVEVTDDGGQWRLPEPDEVAGHGLSIVAAIATSWGVTGGDSGRTVWFEVGS